MLGWGMDIKVRSGIVLGSLLGLASLVGLAGIGSAPPAFAQYEGLPASNELGGEDIWGNPTFTSGTGNNGETASSEW